MVKKTYGEKLKDPRWQKRRLEALQADGFTCQMCGTKEIELHVHHFYYNKNGNPWDVEDHGLITYCKDCHHLMETNLPAMVEDVLMVLQAGQQCTNPDVGQFSSFFRRWIIECILKYYPNQRK